MSFSNTTVPGDKPADPYKATNLTDPELKEKVQDLVSFMESCKFGMMITRIESSGLLTSRCMTLAAKEGGGVDLLFHTNTESGKTDDLKSEPKINIVFLNSTGERGLVTWTVGADIDFKITLISPWRAVCDNAERYSQKRVLLVGDAAATVTPHGGFGGNTGIQASHNLAWKLALVLKGQAGPGLVEQSYHEERHPIGKKTTNQVFERYISRTAPELKTTGVEIEEEVPEPHLELGYRYNSGALDTVLQTAIIEDPTSATSSPGSIARHVVVDIPGHADKIPLADLFGHAFVLLTGPEGQEWASAATGLNRETSLPEIRVYIVSSDQFCTKYGITASGAVLIRPDGFVAWRERHAAIPGHHTKGVPDPSTILQEVMRKILYLEPLTAT